MRIEVIEEIKLEINNKIKNFLHEEGLSLYIAANDNINLLNPLINITQIKENVLSDDKLLFEITIIMGLRDKSYLSEYLIKSLYHLLNPHNITSFELEILLMSLHIEESNDCNNIFQKNAIVKYIVEECQV